MLMPWWNDIYNIMRWWLNLIVVLTISRHVLAQIQIFYKFASHGPHLSDALVEVFLFKDRLIILEF